MSNTESIATERWRSVPGYEGFYEVSDRGHVRSLDREVINRWGPWLRRGQLMTTVKADKTDHRVVRLSMYGKVRSRFVHRLVLEAFVGPCPEGMECCHGNGIADDNRVENLRWDTKSVASMSDLDEWRMAVRDMSDRDRQHTAMELRAADGLSTADGPDGDER